MKIFILLFIVILIFLQKTVSKTKIKYENPIEVKGCNQHFQKFYIIFV